MGTVAGRTRSLLLLLAISAATVAACRAPAISQSAAESPSFAPSTPTAPAGSPAASELALPPDGSWQVHLTDDDLVAAGAPAAGVQGGTFTWTFAQGRAWIQVDPIGGDPVGCLATETTTPDGVRLVYDAGGPCDGFMDTIRWSLDDAGLHLSLVATTGPAGPNKAYLEAKPWQRIAPRPLPTTRPGQP